MTRILALGLAALLLAGAWVLEAPVALDPDVAVVTTIEEEDEASTSRFSHCAWAYADGDIDTVIALASVAEAEYRLAFPAAGELEPLDPEILPPMASIGIPLSSMRVQGDAPTIVEFSDGPAAAAVAGRGDTELSASVCPGSLPKVWSVPGATTDNEVRFVLRLLNPFADDARVAIKATSELGSEALPDFDSVSIPPRAMRTILVHEEIPGRASVAVSIEQAEGSVIPMAEIGTDSDIAVWPAVRQSETWELPVTAIDGVAGELMLHNDALIEINYSIDVFGEDGSVETGPSGTVPGPGIVSIPLADLVTGGPTGIRVSADGPIAAAVSVTSESGLAVATGLPTASTRWLVPGPNSEPSAQYSLWILNSGVEDVNVDVRFLDTVGDAQPAEPIVLAATSLLSIAANELGSTGILIEASGPVSVAYTATVAGAVAIGEAVPVGE